MREFRGWKVNTGGMNLPRGLAEKALDLGIEIFHGYGMSETCPILTLANLKPPMMDWDRQAQLDYRTKTGFPVPLVDLRVVDEDGNEVPRDGKSTGQIVVRAPWLARRMRTPKGLRNCGGMAGSTPGTWPTSMPRVTSGSPIGSRTPSSPEGSGSLPWSWRKA